MDALTSRIGRAIMRELATNGPLTSTELMAALEIQHRQTLTRTLYPLEALGVVTADLPAEERFGRSARYSLVPDQVRHQLRELEDYLLGTEITPPTDA